MIQTQLNGFLSPEFNGPAPAVDLRNPPKRTPAQFPAVEIRDGRQIQANGRTEAELFRDNWSKL